MTIEAIESWTTALLSRPLAWAIYGAWLASGWLVTRARWSGVWMYRRCARNAAAGIAGR